MDKSEQRPIRQAIPHIFKRPLLTIQPSDPLVQAGTFLAIGPQIYVDGLVAIEDGLPVGRLGGQHIIQFILDRPEDTAQATVSDVMVQPASAVNASSPVATALDIFAETYFAFVPITDGSRAIASLSIRDVLRIAALSDLKTPVEEISSSLFSVKNDSSIGDVLEMMLERGIRNVVTRNENGVMHLVNDRKILEFLMSHDGRQMLSSKNLKRIYDIQVGALELPIAKDVPPTMPASSAAELLSDIATPCLLTSDRSIISPWDIVMKGFRA